MDLYPLTRIAPDDASHRRGDPTSPRKRGEVKEVHNPTPHLCAACSIQSRYSVSGVTPVMPPHPAAPFGPVDQLTTPTMTGPPCLSSKTGAPESPVQAPSPSRVPCPTGSTSLICNVPGLPVATRSAARMVPPLLPSPRTVTPMPAMVKRLPTLIGISGDPSTAGVLPLR